jgi:transcriptional regulator with XRE-family HTH domain
MIAPFHEMSIPFFKKVNKFVAFWAKKIYNRLERRCKRMTAGDKIKQRRLELGWSLRELAKRMGYANQSTISRIESGEIDIPQSKVVKFAEVMGTSVAFLMDWEEEKKKNNIQADIVLRMRSDSVFLSAVEALYEMDSEKLAGFLRLIK